MSVNKNVTVPDGATIERMPPRQQKATAV